MQRFYRRLIVFFFFSYTSFAFSNVHSSNYPKNQSNEEYTLTDDDDDIRHFDKLVNRRSDSTETFGLLIYEKFKERFKKTKSIESKSRVAFFANRLGDYYSKTGVNDADKAIEYYNFSLKLKKEINEKGRPYIYTKLGFVAFNNGRYALAIQSSIRALELSEQIKNKTKEELVVVLFAQGTLGNIYTSMRDYKTAIDYLERGALTSKKAQSKYGEAGCLNSIGKIISKLEGPSIALPYFKKSFHLYSSEREKIVTAHSGQIARIAINISQEYLALHQLDSAYRYAEKAVEYSSILNERFSMLDISILQAQLAFEVEDYHLAEHFAKSGLNYIDNQHPMAKRRLYEILMKIYETQNNLPQTLKYSKLFEAARDSVMDRERQKDMIAMNTKIELKKLDKKNKQALNQKQAELAKVIDVSKTNKQRIYFGFALFLLVTVCSFWGWYKRHKKKVSTKMIEAELQLKNHLEKIRNLESKVSNESLRDNSLNAELINKNMGEVLHTKLTARELDVLLELSKGKNNSEIGESLFISVNTVRTHLLKVYDKWMSRIECRL